MREFPICPDGYNDEPVVLSHIGLENHRHPDHPNLLLAVCAPIWFNPIHGPTVKKVLFCPACSLALKRMIENNSVYMF